MKVDREMSDLPTYRTYGMISAGNGNRCGNFLNQVELDVATVAKRPERIPLKNSLMNTLVRISRTDRQIHKNQVTRL